MVAASTVFSFVIITGSVISIMSILSSFNGMVTNGTVSTGLMTGFVVATTVSTDGTTTGFETTDFGTSVLAITGFETVVLAILASFTAGLLMSALKITGVIIGSFCKISVVTKAVSFSIGLIVTFGSFVSVGFLLNEITGSPSSFFGVSAITIVGGALVLAGVALTTSYVCKLNNPHPLSPKFFRLKPISLLSTKHSKDCSG